MREHKNKKREVLLKMSFLFSIPFFFFLSTIQFYPVSKLRVTGGGRGRVMGSDFVFSYSMKL